MKTRLWEGVVEKPDYAVIARAVWLSVHSSLKHRKRGGDLCRSSVCDMRFKNWR
jgi:hypothetical protein